MSDHIPDLTKMIGDTPRTDAALRRAQEDCTESYLVTEGLQLERELSEANKRIKRLEEDLMDAKNQYAVLVADVVLYEDRGERIKQLEGRIDLLMSANADVARIAGELNAAEKRVLYLESALRKIANQDYRGNRSTESQIAFEALKEAKP